MHVYVTIEATSGSVELKNCAVNLKIQILDVRKQNTQGNPV